MAAFLGVTIGDDDLASIAGRCSFARMSVDEKVIGGNTPAGRAAVLRKGVVGDWRREFSQVGEELRNEIKRFDR